MDAILAKTTLFATPQNEKKNIATRGLCFYFAAVFRISSKRKTAHTAMKHVTAAMRYIFQVGIKKRFVSAWAQPAARETSDYLLKD